MVISRKFMTSITLKREQTFPISELHSNRSLNECHWSAKILRAQSPQLNRVYNNYHQQITITLVGRLIANICTQNTFTRPTDQQHNNGHFSKFIWNPSARTWTRAQTQNRVKSRAIGYPFDYYPSEALFFFFFIGETAGKNRRAHAKIARADNNIQKKNFNELSRSASRGKFAWKKGVALKGWGNKLFEKNTTHPGGGHYCAGGRGDNLSFWTAPKKVRKLALVIHLTNQVEVQCGTKVLEIYVFKCNCA